MSADGTTTRARDIIERHLPAMPDQMAAFVTRDAARALGAAGLLASPARDAAVAARAVRAAAHGLDHSRTYKASDIKILMYAIADRIEREGGVS